MERNKFLFDINKCVGCQACSVACANENQTEPPIYWRNIYQYNPYQKADAPVFFYSLACNHCEEAPCLKNCPANAYTKDPETNAVVHHPERCIGCKYCTWACPFDAPKFNATSGIIEKCTFCTHRTEEGEKPACAAMCPTGALDYKKGELSSEPNVNFYGEEHGPSIDFVDLRKKSGPKSSLQIDIDYYDTEALIKHEKPKINAREEWPLIAFTYLAVILSSWYMLSVVLSDFIQLIYIPFSFPVFAVLAIISFVLSAMHLGKKMRAWRSILNLKNSWLSREIFFYGAFIGLVFLHQLFFKNAQWFGYIAGIIAFLALISIDKLYHLAQFKQRWKWNTGNTIFMSLFLILLFMGNIQIAIIVSLIKLMLYWLNSIEKISWRFSKIVLSFSGVLLLIFQFTGLGIVLILMGELLERIEFYNSLEIQTPAQFIANKKNEAA